MDNLMENISEAELLNLMKNSCRLCLSESQSRVNLLTKERPGLTLLEMVNSLTGLHVSEVEGTKSLMVCLNCAGKVVSLHEFRELCHVSDKKFNQMEMALRLKQMQKGRVNNSGMSLDEDMQIFYVCKVCKLSFEDSQFEEYKEHKAQHITNGDVQAQSTPVKQEVTEQKKGRKRRSFPEPVASTSLVSNLYNCRHCSLSFPTFMSRHEHETNFHPKNGKAVVNQNETFPSTKKRRSYRSPVPKYGFGSHNRKTQQSPKIYQCESCNQTFANHKAQYWHKLKAHGFFGKSKHSNKVQASKSPKVTVKVDQFACRYCPKSFDKRHSKYNHEKVCPAKQQDEQSEDSEVVEQPMPVEPVVELTEDNASQANGDTEENLKCSRCNDEFSSGRARSLHEKNIHNLQVNECRVCSKMFSSYASRYQHEKKCPLSTSGTVEPQEAQDDAGPHAVPESGFQVAFAESL